jgi:hypothetical protein
MGSILASLNFETTYFSVSASEEKGVLAADLLYFSPLGKV